jgi:hypothetical protein
VVGFGSHRPVVGSGLGLHRPVAVVRFRSHGPVVVVRFGLHRLGRGILGLGLEINQDIKFDF